jgi:hypothetical protein
VSFEWTPTGLAAVWGAILSTALGVIRVIEYLSTRAKLELSPILRSDEELGHDILIKNNSTVPVTIHYMDVVRANKAYDESSMLHLVHFDDNHILFKIEPRGAHSVTFSENEYFPTKKGPIFLRLWIVGRKKPLWLRI